MTKHFTLRVLYIFGIALLANSCSTEQKQSKNRELIVETHSLKPYSQAETVRLFINDLPMDVNGLDGMSNPDGRELTKEERRVFEAAISKKIVIQRPESDGEVGYGAACFVPHHFFRYYDGNGNNVGEIEVCFCCEDANSNPQLIDADKDMWVEYDVPAIKQFVKSLNLPTDVNCDM